MGRLVTGENECRASECMQDRIRRRARDFDLPALLRVLKRCGYADDEVFIESNPESTSGPSLVEDIVFELRPMRRVCVLVNMGLLGSSSPLPSYFFRLIEGATEPEPFEDFIHYFDNVLLRNRAKAVMPEEDIELWGEKGRTKASYFGMLGPGSVATLSQVITWYFPELGCQVHRRAFHQTTSAHACRTGISRLDGSGVVGKHYSSEAEGFGVELFVDEERTGNGRSWPHLVRQRLHQQVLPLLAGARMPLTVMLNVLSHDTWVKLQHEGYLGFERVVAEEPGAHRMRIYTGFTGIAESA